MAPGHAPTWSSPAIFPLQAVDGGVLMRAPATPSAGCDLAHGRAARRGRDLRDRGRRWHHGRLPDLEVFASRHGLKIGTISSAPSIESLVARGGGGR